MKKIIAFFLFLLMLLACVFTVSCDEQGEKDMYLQLINKENSVGADYIPDDLDYIDASYTAPGKNEPLQMERKALEQAVKMLDAMKNDGIANVTITSAYRTYEYQKTLFDRYCRDEKAAHGDWSDEQIKEYVLTYSAYPGTSEHQSGLCMDLITTEMEGLWNYGSETPKNPYDKGFAETDAYAWLCENAHKYGFILRFPENKTDVTGYSYESWHYRYVGLKAAEEIHEKGITLEEYLEK